MFHILILLSIIYANLHVREFITAEPSHQGEMEQDLTCKE